MDGGGETERGLVLRNVQCKEHLTGISSESSKCEVFLTSDPTVLALPGFDFSLHIRD